MDTFVTTWLSKHKLSEYRSKFKENKIDQRRLLMMDREFAKELIPILGDRMDFLEALEKLKKSVPKTYKVVVPLIQNSRQKENASPEPNAEETFVTVRIKTLDNRNYNFKIVKWTKIVQLKEAISQVYAIEDERKCSVRDRSDQIRLLHKARQLEDGRTVSDYKIKNGDTIDVVQRMCGC